MVHVEVRPILPFSEDARSRRGSLDLLLIDRNMLSGIKYFNDLERGHPGISRPLLARRLRQLQCAGIIEKRLNGAGRNSTEYQLTPAGQELRQIIGAMIVWGEAWACSEQLKEDGWLLPEPNSLTVQRRVRGIAIRVCQLKNKFLTGDNTGET